MTRPCRTEHTRCIARTRWCQVEGKARVDPGTAREGVEMIELAVADRALKRYPMLNDLPAAEREGVFRAASLLKVPVGAVLFDEGEPCRGFALVLSGVVRVSKVAPNGRELHLYDVAPGDSCVLTCACLLGQSTYSARAVAREELEMIVLPAPAFRDLCSRLEFLSRPSVCAFLGAHDGNDGAGCGGCLPETGPASRVLADQQTQPDPRDPSGAGRRTRQHSRNSQPPLKKLRRSGLDSSQPGADRGRQLGQPWSTCCGRFVTFVTDGAVFPALTLGR